MARREVDSIAALADQVLAEVASDERAKEAHIAAVRTAGSPPSELGALIHKLAAELRADTSDDITFADIENHTRRRRAAR